jgi:hypothetical protein
MSRNRPWKRPRRTRPWAIAGCVATSLHTGKICRLAAQIVDITSEIASGEFAQKEVLPKREEGPGQQWTCKSVKRYTERKAGWRRGEFSPPTQATWDFARPYQRFALPRRLEGVRNAIRSALRSALAVRHILSQEASEPKRRVLPFGFEECSGLVARRLPPLRCRKAQPRSRAK